MRVTKYLQDWLTDLPLETREKFKDAVARELQVWEKLRAEGGPEQTLDHSSLCQAAEDHAKVLHVEVTCGVCPYTKVIGQSCCDPPGPYAELWAYQCSLPEEKRGHFSTQDEKSHAIVSRMVLHLGVIDLLMRAPQEQEIEARK